MNEFDRFNAYLTLASFREKRRDTRYSAILRVSVGLWATIAAAILYFKHRPDDYVLLGTIVTVVTGHIVAVRQMQVANWIDINTAFMYIEKAENLLGEKVSIRRRPKDLNAMSWSERWLNRRELTFISYVLWTAPTILLGLLAFVFLGR